MFFSQYLSYTLIAVGVFTAYMALVSALRKDRNKLRVEQISALNRQTVIVDEERKLSPLAGVLKPFLQISGVDFDKQNENIADLARAGYNGENALIYLLAFKRFVQPILLIIGLSMLGNLVIFHRAEAGKHAAALITGLLLAVIGGYGGKLFIANCAEKRSKELMRSLPEALDMILVCVESGLGIDASFARICKEMKNSHPIAAAEFERTRFEMNMMNDRIQALQNFSDRTGLGAVRSLVASLIQAEKFGTSLVDTMRTIAEEQRNERMMNAEARAARLPAMITLPLIFFILPGLFMIILGPAYVKIQEQGGLFGSANKR